MVEYIHHIRNLYDDEASGKIIKKPRHVPAQ
jgi:hypothetical protein